MKTLCAIISGGEKTSLEGIEEADFVIACDKGYLYAKEEGIRPDLLLGDFDSFTGELPPDIPRRTLPKEKDDTDTMSAVRYAIGEGYSSLCIYCALGGRLDHLLSNVQTLAFAAGSGVPSEIRSEKAVLYAFSEKTGRLVLPRREGFGFSVLSLSDKAKGVGITGGRYALTDALVTNTFPIGQSNEWKEEEAVISVEEGILLVILTPGD